MGESVASKLVSGWMNGWIRDWVNQWIAAWMSELAGDCMKWWVNGLVGELIDWNSDLDYSYVSRFRFLHKPLCDYAVSLVLCSCASFGMIGVSSLSAVCEYNLLKKCDFL